MRRKKSSPLRIEALESRMPLAGNVTAGLLRGGLVINGDSGDNSIQITPGPAGQYVVAGVQGTTINGQASQTISGAVGALAIQLRGGSDTLTLNPGTYVGSVVISDLAGSNTVNVDGANVTGVLIITEASADGNTVDVSNTTVGSNFGIYTGNGIDNVSFTNSSSRTAGQIVTGGGSDIVTVRGATVANSMVIDTGLRVSGGFLGNLFNGLFGESQPDNDTVSISGGTLTRLTLTTGGGDDDVTISNLHVTRRVDISTGGGTDTVAISGSTFDAALVAVLGSGDDELTITGTTVAAKSNLSGGSGNDTFITSGSTFTGGLNEDLEV